MQIDNHYSALYVGSKLNGKKIGISLQKLIEFFYSFFVNLYYSFPSFLSQTKYSFLLPSKFLFLVPSI